MVRAHIPRAVPEEWRSAQDHALHDLKDAVKQAVADDKAPGSNRVTAALIAELPEPGSWYTLRGPSFVVRKSRSHGMRPSFG